MIKMSLFSKTRTGMSGTTKNGPSVTPAGGQGKLVDSQQNGRTSDPDGL